MDRRIFADISNYTNRFEAHQVASAGALLVGILATDYKGPFYSPAHDEQARHAHDAGLPVWHYGFARPEINRSGDGEALFLWEHVKPRYRPGDRLVWDVEEAHPGGPTALRDYIHRLDLMLHHISGVHPVLYMPESMFRELAALGLNTLANEYWLAAWGRRILKPLGGRRRMIAQQISNGQEGEQPHSYPGIGACDTNRLQRWYELGILRDRARGKRHG